MYALRPREKKQRGKAKENSRKQGKRKMERWREKEREKVQSFKEQDGLRPAFFFPHSAKFSMTLRSGWLDS